MLAIASPRSGVSERATGAVAEWLRLLHLVTSLAWRDVRVRYSQSLLGLGWTLALPFVTMLVFVAVFGRAMDGRFTDGVAMPYSLYVYTGIVPWTFFSAGLVAALNSLVANRNLVTKAYFSREALPLSCVAAAFADFVAGMLVLVALVISVGGRGGWHVSVGWAWLLVPVLVLIQSALTAGLGMMLALMNLLFRDVRQVIGVLLQLAMFVSAVVIPAPRDGSRLSQVLSFNPMIPLLNGYRDSLILARVSNVDGIVYAAAVSAVVLVAGWWMFRRMSPRFAEWV